MYSDLVVTPGFQKITIVAMTIVAMYALSLFPMTVFTIPAVTMMVIIMAVFAIAMIMMVIDTIPMSVVTKVDSYNTNGYNKILF